MRAPTSLEVFGTNGAKLHTCLRDPDEEVRILWCTRGGKGQPPEWDIAHESGSVMCAITSFRASNHDLEPLATKLRIALAQLPVK
jgi:hypothetical protein